MSDEQGADPGEEAPATEARQRIALALCVGAVLVLTAGGLMVSVVVGLFLLGALLLAGGVALGWEPDDKPDRRPAPQVVVQRRTR